MCQLWCNQGFHILPGGKGILPFLQEFPTRGGLAVVRAASVSCGSSCVSGPPRGCLSLTCRPQLNEIKTSKVLKWFFQCKIGKIRKQLRTTFPEIFWIFWKINIKDKYQVKLFCFLLVISFGRFGVKFFFFKTLDVYISVKCAWQIRLRHPRGGPDTHDNPHEMKAARTAARPLLVQKNHFRNYQKFLNFWLL